ncbi:MAG TPA: hypothetical protein VGI33_00185 [Paenibacillus sp.]|jgi:uncharacterized protein YoxC
MEYTLMSIVLLLLIYLIVTIDKLQGHIKSMQYTLDQVAKKVEIPEAPINDDLRKLLKVEKDVQAVKLVRENMGLSLIEAKKYVDALKFDAR